MRNIHNAVSDVMEHFNGEMNTRIIADPDIHNRWRIEVTKDDSLLDIEVLLLDDTPIACVLQRRNVGRRVMNRFMDLLMEYLD
jgi:hypothetical protein